MPGFTRIGRMARTIVAAVVLIAVGPAPVRAEGWRDGPDIFGYFQAQFYSQTQLETQEEINSFNLQQLNLFLAHDLTPRWSAFVNIEAVNAFSSERNWGSLNLEEAWVRWGPSDRFQLKLGLLIPKFNRLNEIKNRMPVLPYIMRPLVYEASLAHAVALEEYVPRRAYAQGYGYFNLGGGVKLDYAVYLGNTAGVNNDPTRGQTGVDTTDALMGGGRIGLRYRDAQLGVSGTGEPTDFFVGLEDTLGGSPDRFRDVPRARLGVDFSFEVWRFAFESEYIDVFYDEDAPEIDVNKRFAYVTLGIHATERWFFYLSHWHTTQHFNDLVEPLEVDFFVPNIGFAFTKDDHVTFKGQFGTGEYQTEAPGTAEQKHDFDFASFAVSVFF
jgi:hypothetical protein